MKSPDKKSEINRNFVYTDSNEIIPETWPGPFKAYKYSKAAVKLNANAIVGWYFIYVLMSGALSLVRDIKSTAGPIKGLAELVIYLSAPLFTSVICKAMLAGVRRQRVGFSEAFGLGSGYWFNMLVANILVFVSYIFSLALLIIPFFFVLPRLTLVSYFVIDKGLDPIEAYKASWQATEGYAGIIYGILGAEIIMLLPAFTIAGIPYSLYLLVMYSAVAAVLYETITSPPVEKASHAVDKSKARHRHSS